MIDIQADKIPHDRLTVPHYLFIRYPGLCVATIGASLVLSLWAIYLDPVINYDGILYIDAAGYFASGQWSQALAVHKWPFYSIAISLVSAVTRVSITHAAYLANAILYALLVLGFIGVAFSLDGSRRGLWLAAIIALLHPTFNEFRAFVIRDIGYWAFYLWSLAYLFSYLKLRQRYLLALALFLGTAAFLFRVEGIVLLIVLLACLLFERQGWKPGRRILLGAVAGVIAIVAVSFPLWEYKTGAGFSVESLLSNPLTHLVDSWRSVSLDIVQRLDALRREFPFFSNNMSTFLVYVTTSVTMLVSETINSLGTVYTGLVVYALVYGKGLVDDEARAWWWTLVTAHGFLILIFAFSEFFLADRYCVGLAMTLLVIVPSVLDRLWSEWRHGNRRRSWWVGLVAVLLLIEGAEGLDLRTEKQYLREAGLWLRANAAPGSTIYSNNRILLYYSGMKEASSHSNHSWEEAMSEVWTGRWRDHDYFALEMTRSDTQNEVLVLRMVDAKALKEFRSKKGDKVMIFRGEGTGG